MTPTRIKISQKPNQSQVSRAVNSILNTRYLLRAQQSKLKKAHRHAFKPHFDLDVNVQLRAMSCRGNKCVRKEKCMKFKLNLGRKCHKNITFIKRFSNHLDRIVVCLFLPARSTSEIEVPLIIK